MAIERTLSIIKPDAVAKNVIGQIYARFEAAGLKIVAAAWRTCRVARPRPSMPCTRRVRSSTTWSSFMISGPVMIQVLEGEGAIAQEPRTDGRHRPEEGREGHHPRRLRRQHRRQCRARLRRCRDRRGGDRLLLPRHERLQPLTRRRAAGRSSAWARSTCSTSTSTAWPPTATAWGRSAFAPRSCSAGSTRRARPISTRMSDLAQVAARQAGRRGRGARAGR